MNFFEIIITKKNFLLKPKKKNFLLSHMKKKYKKK